MRLLRVLPFAAAALLAAAAQSSAARSPSASAQAVAVLVRLPGGDPLAVAGASAPPLSRGHAAPAVYPSDGSIVRAAVADTDAHLGPGWGRSGANVVLRDVSVFGGEITIASLELDASAYLEGRRARGSLSSPSFTALTVLGQPVDPTANERIPLGSFGYAVVLEQAVVRQGSDGTGYRGIVSGLHIYLTADHGGLPSGSELVVGYADAATRAPKLPDRTAGQPPAGATKGSSQGAEPVRKPPGSQSTPPPIVRNPPPGIKPAVTGLGYVFPVYGAASFSDDFGAPRADTGWHHGNDVFAPLGAPVLAVTNGVLFSVGWNELGGNRLWLRDAQGNEYYYAHLSAYAPLTRNGAFVHAGDVLGFVGDTGDARGTPYHLHFELHPAALLGLGYDGVVDPYEYLLAWRRVTDVRADAFSVGDAGQAPAPAAIPLPAQDISSVSGLVPGALEGAVGLPDLLDEGGLVPVRSGTAPLVGARPGLLSLR